LFTWQGKLKAMGLGSHPLVSLAEARELRDKWRKDLRSGRNPIEARRAKETSSKQPTFGNCAADFLKAKSTQWRNVKHRSQWRMTLETYGASLWNLPVDKVDTAAVLSVLTPCLATNP
jgi:hypothetical protein